MDGIVSILDQEHQDLIEGLWEELGRQFGLRGIYTARFPHFSYHVAEDYDSALLTPVLAQFAHGHAPFRVRTSGLGIFNGPQPVLYIPVVRTPELSLFHQDLWLAVAGTGNGAIGLYHPQRWLPHITLAHGDISKENLPEVIRFLSDRNFNWEIGIDNVMLVVDAGTDKERRVRYTLGTQRVPGLMPSPVP